MSYNNSFTKRFRKSDNNVHQWYEQSARRLQRGVFNMFTCAQCGALLESSKQACRSCQRSSLPVLPTLAGFGNEDVNDGLKTLLSPRSLDEVKRQEEEFNQTLSASDRTSVPSNTYASSNTVGFPNASSTNPKSLLTLKNDHLGRRDKSRTQDLDVYDPLESENLDFTISEDHELSLGEDVTTVEFAKEARLTEPHVFKTSVTPPPIPPPHQSIGGVKLKGIMNPFQVMDKEYLSATFYSLWFGLRGQTQKNELSVEGELFSPYHHKKVGQVYFKDQEFSFGEHFNEEVWCPTRSRVQMIPGETIRSGGAIIRLVEMTINETEVISQPAIHRMGTFMCERQ